MPNFADDKYFELCFHALALRKRYLSDELSQSSKDQIKSEKTTRSIEFIDLLEANLHNNQKSKNGYAAYQCSFYYYIVDELLDALKTLKEQEPTNWTEDYDKFLQHTEYYVDHLERSFDDFYY